MISRKISAFVTTCIASVVLVGCASQSMPEAPLTETQLTDRVLSESQLPAGFESDGDPRVLDIEEFSLREKYLGGFFALNALENVQGDCQNVLDDLWRSSVDTHAALVASYSDWQDGIFDAYLLSTAAEGDVTGAFDAVGGSCSEEQNQNSSNSVYEFDQMSGDLSGFEVVLKGARDDSEGEDVPDPNYRVGAMSYGNNHIVVEAGFMNRENFDEILEAALESFENPTSVDGTHDG
ncbi:hypothetical protein [Garicola koreensis]|uniref:Uncharacterized protein n=1 Tax=Garicola koreensis TaxID=1262554 RepID=A0A7W5XYZ6_9MICC|nr:hypothetical protein [Garicola koreensis]MBB3667011.1 hypothetical protein [Garicola koreensis]